MAASDAKPIPLKATAYRVTFPILDADGDLVTGAAGLDSEVSKDAGTFADCTNEATEIATSSGMYYLDLTSTEMDADTVAIIVKTSTAGAKTTPIVLYPEETGDIRVNVTQISGDTTAADNAEAFFDGTGYAGTGNTIPNVTTVNGLAANVITAASMAADASAEIADAVWDEDATGHQTQGSFGQVLGDSGADADSIWSLANTNLDATVSSRASQTSVNTIDDFIDTEIADIQSRLPAALVGGRMDSSVGAMAANVVTAAAVAADVTTELRALASGTSDSGSTTTMVDAARTEADTDYWKGAIILFTSGTIAGQSRLITGFDPATDTITFAPATTQAVATQTYEILADARADLGLWLGSAPNALSSGRVDTTVGAMQADVVTAAAIATDAIGSAELAASAVTEIQSGLATAAALATVQADTDDIQTRLPAALVGGRMDSSVGAMAANTLTASALAADAGAEIADAVWDEATSGHTTSGTFGQAAQPIRAGTAQAGAASTITLDSGASASDDFYNNQIIVVTSGTGAPQSRIISDYVGSTKVATVNGNWVTNPSSDSVFVILPFGSIPGASAPTAAEIADAVWDEDATGHQTQGSFGQVLGDSGADSDSVWGLVNTNLDATISSRASSAALATVQADTDDIQTRLPAALVGGRIDANVGAISSDATAADNAEAFFDGTGYAGTGNTIPTVTNVTNGVTVSTNNDKTGYGLSAAAVQAIWDALTSALTTAGSIGKRLVDNIDATISSRLASASYTAPPTAAANADAVWDEARADHTAAGSFGQGAASVQGNVTGSVGSVATGGIVAASFAAGAIDSAAIATDAIGSAELAASAVTEIQSGLSTLTAAQVNAEVVDALATDTYAEPGSVPAATSSLKDKIGWLFMLARNKRNTTSTSDVVRNDGDSSTIGTSTISDDGTTFVRGKYS